MTTRSTPNTVGIWIVEAVIADGGKSGGQQKPTGEAPSTKLRSYEYRLFLRALQRSRSAVAGLCSVHCHDVVVVMRGRRSRLHGCLAGGRTVTSHGAPPTGRTITGAIRNVCADHGLGYLDASVAAMLYVKTSIAGCCSRIKRIFNSLLIRACYRRSIFPQQQCNNESARIS
ncbi:hypothetical protein QTP88_025933 [Uroleucon formosanum]